MFTPRGFRVKRSSTLHELSSFKIIVPFLDRTKIQRGDPPDCDQLRCLHFSCELAIISEAQRGVRLRISPTNIEDNRITVANHPTQLPPRKGVSLTDSRMLGGARRWAVRDAT